MNVLELTTAIAATTIGFLVAVLASRRAVSTTTQLAAGTRIPRFVIGFTLLAIGTDLPEIANSIVSSVSGHGDLNVGDSVGSAATQITLVLGLFPLIGGVTLAISRRRFARAGVASIGALLLGLALMSDGFISRTDALILIGAWAFGSFFTWDPGATPAQLDLPLDRNNRVGKALFVLVALAIVAGGAILAVWGMTTLAELFSVPQYLIAFFGASLARHFPSSW